MPDLKLAKLPDRTPVKVTIQLAPDLHTALRGYAALYRAAYGTAETVAELVPYIVRAFLDSDRGFAKARKSATEDLSLAIPATSERGRRPRAQAEVGTKSNPAEER